MRKDDIARLRQLDFNLLKTLSVLLKYKHISKSAELLFLTQPAVSKQLTRLREMFDDPLLVRTGNQLLLTPKAERIYPQVVHICEQVKDLVLPDELNLLEVDTTVKIMFADYGSPHWISGLSRILHEQAPNVTIVCKEWSDSNIQQLLAGEVDIALGPLIGSETLCESIKVGSVSNSFIARKGHPLFLCDGSSPAFDSFPLVRISGSVQYQQMYSQIFPDNPVMLDQASMWLALDTLKYSDAVLIGPTQVMQELAKSSDFRCQLLPQVPNVDICLSWTKGLRSDLFYDWLIEQLTQIGIEITSS